KYGLHATASRTVSFGPPNDPHEAETATRVFATRFAASIPGSTTKTVFDAGQEFATAQEFPHEWRLNSAGHLTGWLPVEDALKPTNVEPLESGWALTLTASIGAALCQESLLIGESPPFCITSPEDWPIKRLHVQGISVEVPDILIV